jgi:TatD DNase family protein
MELVDTHAHLNFDSYSSDLEAVIAKSQAAGVKTIINVGTDLEESKNSIKLAEKYSFIHPTVGIHPIDTPEINIEESVKELAELADNPLVVAIGECGLDFYRQTNPNEQIRQIQLFEGQITLAREKNLPLIVHSREAWAETLSTIKKHKVSRGVFHSWTYSPPITEDALKETEFYFAFNGIVTFKNASEVAESCVKIPEDRLLIETDCPFLTPDPHRGLRNEPAFVTLVANKVADLRNTPASEIAQITTRNANSLFNL